MRTTIAVLCLVPSAIAAGLQVVVPGSAGPSCYCQGDPHCKTFDNKKYDWMGRCDYTFVKDERAASSGFEIQIRNSEPMLFDHKPDHPVTMIVTARVKLPATSSAELWKNGYSCERTDQGPYLGNTFQTPAQCLAAAANTAGCGDSVIWSPANNAAWGCRCCKPSFTTPTNQNSAWQLWRMGAPQSDVLTLVRDPNCLDYWPPLYPPGMSKGWPGKVNGAQLQIPYKTANYEISFEANPKPDFAGWNANGKTVMIRIPSLKAEVIWTTCNRIEVRLDPGSPLVGNTGGMCADANGQLGGEMALVEDKCYHAVQPASSLFETQKSGCPDDKRCVEPPPPPMCKTPAALAVCGCFDEMSACHRAVPAKELYNACMFDACAMPGHETLAASSCAAYESECCDAGILMPGCPPWTLLTKAPTFGAIIAAPKENQGFEITASGDPFTTYNGKRTQFWLPLNKKTLLIKSPSGVALFGGVMPTGIEGDNQQWFNAIDVHEHGRTVVSIGVHANATLGTAATNMDDVSIIMPPRNLLGDKKKLEIITVSIAGKAVPYTTTSEVTVGVVGVNISKADTETVHFESPGLAARVQASEATKFADNKARKYTHLDLAFTNIVNVTSFTGILPEVWGVKEVSQETASFLIPPTW